MHSISMAAPSGSTATPTHVREWGCFGKNCIIGTSPCQPRTRSPLYGMTHRAVHLVHRCKVLLQVGQEDVHLEDVVRVRPRRLEDLRHVLQRRLLHAAREHRWPRPTSPGIRTVWPLMSPRSWPVSLSTPMLPETYTVLPLIVACADHPEPSVPARSGSIYSLTEHGQGSDCLLGKNGLLRDGHGRYCYGGSVVRLSKVEV